jgi:hypothetical protein
MANNLFSGDEIRQRVQQTEAKVVAATGALVAVRAEAVQATLRKRDLDFCRAQGVLSSDDVELIRTTEQARQASCRLSEAKARLASVQQVLFEANTDLALHEAGAIRERRKAWVRKHRPETVEALREAHLEYEAVSRDNWHANASAGNPQIVATRERLRRAQESFEAVCAEAPV